MIPPWFKVQVGKKILVIREEKGGCGIRCGFVCVHGNATLHRLLWEFATKESIEAIEGDITSEYGITSEEFNASIAEADALLKELGFLSENLKDAEFMLLKVKGGT